MLHCHRLVNFQEAKAKALQDDPECKKVFTQKCMERVEQNLHVEKYLVFNPRTGQMATEAWLGKHIHVVAGKPKFKHPSKEHKDPKILTLEIKFLDDNVELTLDISDSTIGPRPVRCFDLSSSQPQGDLTVLTMGFSHMGGSSIEEHEDGAVESDGEIDPNEFEDEIPDDAQGLEGATWKS